LFPGIGHTFTIKLPPSSSALVTYYGNKCCSKPEYWHHPRSNRS